ncbi:MAG: DUF2218 domain-containing protein [Geminicoccaceae bacterium]
MPTTKAEIATAHASRYLQQLCKHFAHKLPVTFDPTRGRIEFPLGICELVASTGLLTMQTEAGDETRLAEVEMVVARHLERFAFREDLKVEWGQA